MAAEAAAVQPDAAVVGAVVLRGAAVEEVLLPALSAAGLARPSVEPSAVVRAEPPARRRTAVREFQRARRVANLAVLRLLSS
ncbi:MAG: hypothetical protein AB1342_02110 [Pseudomonadota bacterium]